METLLRNDFTSHFGLLPSSVTNLSLSTNASYFEIEDDSQKELQIYFQNGLGMAAFVNSTNLDIGIINFDKFISKLPETFQHGKGRCDAIVYTETTPQYFSLNELKDRKPKPKVRKIARKQLTESLQLLLQVPAIAQFIHTFLIKKCCIFNKQAIAPIGIIAPSAFNRLNNLNSNGFRLNNPEIESLGFELFEFAGNQVATF